MKISRINKKKEKIDSTGKKITEYMKNYSSIVPCKES